MTSGDVISIARETVWIIVKTAVPVLLVSMIVGLIISLFQTLTSIQEQTLTFVPKLLAIFIALMVMGSGNGLAEDADRQEKLAAFLAEMGW